MRSFLKKLPILISLIVVTLAITGLTIGFLITPVGWNFKVNMYGGQEPIPATFVLNGNIAKLTYTDTETNKETTKEYLAIKDGSRYAIYLAEPLKVDGVENSNKNQIIQQAESLYNEMTPEVKEKFYNGTYFNITGFNGIEPTYKDTTYLQFASSDNRNSAYYAHFYGLMNFQGRCSGAIVYTVCMSVLFAVSLGFTILSTVFYIKGKKE